jgi:plastocyanin
MTATPTTTAQTTVKAYVDIQNSTFVPTNVTVANGTTVIWTNDDTVPHTVTSVTGAFDSGNINPGATYSYTFNQDGEFEYSCSIHPSIPHGTVTVLFTHPPVSG